MAGEKREHESASDIPNPFQAFRSDGYGSHATPVKQENKSVNGTMVPSAQEPVGFTKRANR
jgi:hypothetical protein